MAKYLANSDDITIEEVIETDSIRFNTKYSMDTLKNGIDTNAEDIANICENSESSSQTKPYSADYINDCNTYSTNETFTGKYWKDGKPIYKKILEFTLSSTTNTYVNVAHDISNIETKISYDAYYLYSNELYKMPNSEVKAIKFGNTNFSYYNSTSGLSGSSAYAILEFTRTN